MTKATIYRQKNGDIERFSIKGHAGAHMGGEYDLVCAAISAVAYTALGGLKELCGIATYKESDGSLTMKLPKRIPAEVWAKAQIILETMVVGLRQIQHQHQKHIQVLYKEV